MQTKRFAIAHLYKEEKTMEMHIHDCCEVYYSISGGRQFLIDNKLYDIEPGDIFVISQYESHYIAMADSMVHERIVLSIHPDYLKELSGESTDLAACFTTRGSGHSHRISLSKADQERFLYLKDKICSHHEFGEDVIEKAAFMEMMVLINKAFAGQKKNFTPKTEAVRDGQVDAILSYINANISSPLTINDLAAQFYLSDSYICRIFKAATGTTINKYISARRISIAKALLNEGVSVQDAFIQSGFTDYSGFFKAFTKAVGISPKRYSQVSVK